MLRLTELSAPANTRSSGKGVMKMDYQKLVFVGNVTRAPQRQTSEKGDVTYTTFSVAVSTGKDRTVFFPVTVFGKQSEAVAEYVTKGRQVLVEGRLAQSASGRMNVVADRVVFGVSPEKKKEKPKAK
jgi:single-stranded DNA-binding protein